MAPPRMIGADLRAQIEEALLGIARVAGDQLEQVLVDRARRARCG